MKKIAFGSIWMLCFFSLLFACDQFLIRYHGDQPALVSDFQQFYRDFRRRVLSMAESGTVTSIEAVLATPAATASTPAAAGGGQRYIYIDDQKSINFASSFSEIPAAFRASAQKLEN